MSIRTGFQGCRPLEAKLIQSAMIMVLGFERISNSKVDLPSEIRGIDRAEILQIGIEAVIIMMNKDATKFHPLVEGIRPGGRYDPFQSRTFIKTLKTNNVTKFDAKSSYFGNLKQLREMFLLYQNVYYPVTKIVGDDAYDKRLDRDECGLNVFARFMIDFFSMPPQRQLKVRNEVQMKREKFAISLLKPDGKRLFVPLKLHEVPADFMFVEKDKDHLIWKQHANSFIQYADKCYGCTLCAFKDKELNRVKRHQTGMHKNYGNPIYICMMCKTPIEKKKRQEHMKRCFGCDPRLVVEGHLCPTTTNFMPSEL
uniref:C2H2-type domain-containing protein n=1 Tax=Panagrolaimus superbus TaxID=310955 RepID=A0A914Z1E9_9BILA